MTAEQLILEVRQLAQLPSVDSADAATPSAEADTDEGILAIANREMRGKLLSDVLALREEFFVLKQDFPITEAAASYRIPSRAIGAKLRDVFYTDSGGASVGVPRLRPEDVQSQYRWGFYIQNNSVVMRSEINTGTMTLSYFARPGKLVKVSGVYKVFSVDAANKTITLTTNPFSAFDGTTISVDVQKAGSPFEYVVASAPAVCSTVSSKSVLTFSVDIGAAAANDLVALEDNTNYVQLPEEAANVLVYRTAAKVLETVGDSNGANALRKSAVEMEDAMRVLLTPRVDGKAQKFSSKALFGRRWW